METENNAQAIIDAVKGLHGHSIIGTPEIDKLALALVPKDVELKSLQPYLDALRENPRYIGAKATATTTATFADYLNRFKTTDSAIFVNDNPSGPTLTAIIDFHGQGDSAQPRYGHHRLSYGFPLSDQIKEWSTISGKPLGHSDMSTFISEHQYDIANPPLDWMAVDPAQIKVILELLNIHDDGGEIDDGAPEDLLHDEEDDRYVPRSALHKLRRIRFASAARLVQMGRTVEISANAKTVEGYNPKTGERTVTFEEEHQAADKAGRRIIVPDAFLLRVPVWEGEAPQLIPVRLQYRRKDGSVKWFLTLVEWRRVVRMAVRASAEEVRAATNLPLFYGAP